MTDNLPWVVTTATVMSSSQSLLRSSYGGDNSVPRPEYNVRFSYRVNGKQYYGTMSMGTRWDEGRTFEISYDPQKPRRNSASRSFDPYDWHSYIRYLIVWGLGAILTYLLIRYVPLKYEIFRP